MFRRKPDLDSSDCKFYTSLTMRFENEADLAEFSKRVGTMCMKETKSINYPKKDPAQNDLFSFEE